MPPTNRRRRRTVILSSAPAAALLVGAMVATAATSPAADSTASTQTGTAVATARDLAATLTADGVVETADSAVVIYGRTAAVPEEGDSSGVSTATGSAQTSTAQASTAQTASLDTGADQASETSQKVTLVGYTSTSTETPAPTSTETPTPTPTATETGPPESTPTTQPTAPTETTPPATAPPSTVPTAPAGQPTVQPTQPTTGGGVPSGSGSGTVPSGGSTQGQVGATGQSLTAQPAKTLTGMADLGDEVTTGTKLYTVDGEPVVAVVADTPSWRTLKKGVADGEDVRTLERALTKLGYGKHLTVDKHFTTATADAVKKWEKALHREDPDGVVHATDLVIIAQDSQVVDQALTVGDSVPDGSQVLTLASSKHVITASVAADDITAWGKDATVTVRWADGETFTGRVSAVSRDIDNTADDVTDATADVTIVPTKGAIDQHTGTSADVELVTKRIADAITVPVSALHDGPGGNPAVTVVKAGVASERSVTLGLVTQGWAEVSDLQAGETVRLPGSSAAGSENA